MVGKCITRFFSRDWSKNSVITSISVLNKYTNIYRKVPFNQITHISLPPGTTMKDIVDKQKLYDETRDKFNSLANEWILTTAHMSSIGARIAHPLCREIVSMGWDVVPHILAHMHSDVDWWGPVLSEITGEDPVKEDARGNVEAIAEYWFGWGRLKGVF